MKKLITIAALALCGMAQADPVQSTTITGDNGRADHQLIGDTDASQNDINSTSTQLGNSANANGATITTGVDTRDQNTVNSAGGAAMGGSATGNTADNRSAVGNTSASSGGNSVAGGAVTGATTGTVQGSTTGSVAGQNTSTTTSGGGAGGNSGAAAQGGAGAAGNSATTVDARNQSQYSSRATVWAPVTHGPAAPALAAAGLVVVPGDCGPRVGIVRRDVVGDHTGMFGGREVVQGQDEISAPAAEPFVQIGPYLMGHRVTVYTAVIGTSSGSSASLAGFGGVGNGAQLGGSANGQRQQVTQRVTIQECVMAQAVPQPQVVLQQTLVPAPRQDRN